MSHPSDPSPEWIDKHEAARRLGVDPRTALSYAKRGVQSKRQYDPTLKQDVTLLHAGDIERVLYARSLGQKLHEQGAREKETAVAPVPKPVAQSAAVGAPHKPPAGQPPHTAPYELMRIALVEPAPLKPWLTLDEAVEYSGLPRAFLLELLKDAEHDSAVGFVTTKLPALDVGKGRRGGRWRIARRDLDALKP
jgi:hypothetical protein